MNEISLISPYTVDFIDRVGFPIFMTVIIISIIIWMMKKDEKRQDKSDDKYTLLINEFISTMRTMINDNQQILLKMTQELQESTVKINSNILKTQVKIEEIEDDVKNVQKSIEQLINKKFK